MPDTRVHSISQEAASVAVAAELTAVIVAVTDGQPRVLTIERAKALINPLLFAAAPQPEKIDEK
jgi:hypothetical protein